MNYKIRKISDINVALLNEFYKAAYPNRYNNLNNHWRWYYRMGYNNFEPIIIEVNSKIIGMAGLIPSKLKYNNLITEAIWFTDFFILKEFRNKGYGSILTKEWMKICPVQITFCNNKSLQIFKKFSWQSNSKTCRNIKPINLLRIIPFIKNFDFTLNKKIQKIFLREKNKDYKTLSPKQIENNDILKLCNLENKKKLNEELFSIIHDEDWFKWRLVESPYRKNIYLFKNNSDVIIANIFEYKNLKRLNVLYSYLNNLNNTEIYDLVVDWSFKNKIDYVWYINNQDNILFKENKIISNFFKKRINFACWSQDEAILSNLKKGLSNSQGSDSDIDSILFQDQ
jgi:predicted acetyltransferase